MEFAESKAGAAREIALAFGLPPLLLGLPGDNTFANYAEANRAFWRQTVLPLVARVQKSFQSWLQPAYGDFRLDYNADRLEALASERSAEWERVGKAPFLTLDEQREAVGYGPAPRNAFGKAGLEQRYSPGQPRVAAGSPQGGQWTSGGGGGGALGSEDVVLNLDRDLGRAVDAQIQRVQDGKFSVDLAEEEAQGGHTLARHVARSKEQLIQRADRNRIDLGKYGIWEDQVGSFKSLFAANSLVNETRSQFPSFVDEVRSGKITFAKLEAWFASPTGYQSYRRRFHDPVVFRETFGVRIILIHDPRSTKGFRIRTAYPINRDN